MISSSRCGDLVAAVAPSEQPARLRLAKSVKVPLSAAVTPTLGGAVWLLNFTKKHSSSSLALPG